MNNTNKIIKEAICKDVVFHFNKKSIEDPSLPAWVLKFKGESFYVNHVDCNIPWSTKETPDNAATKGSIKVKHCLITIDDSNSATLSALSEHDKTRIRNEEKGITRIITREGKALRDSLKNNNIKHGPIKAIGGACTTTFYVTDVLEKAHMSMLSLTMGNTDFRVLKPNEGYYKLYDDPKYKEQEYID